MKPLSYSLQTGSRIPIQAVRSTMSKVFQGLGSLLPVLMLASVAVATAPCNPYRTDYESAIAQGLLKRPSLVSGSAESWALFEAAIAQGDRIEVAARAAQYLVIVSEGPGIAHADQMRRQLEDKIITHYQQPVEVAVPMLGVILSYAQQCPISPVPPESLQTAPAGVSQGRLLGQPGLVHPAIVAPKFRVPVDLTVSGAQC